MSKKIFITTLGCKVNQFESAAFKTGFEEAGHTIVSKNEKADIVVVNSCCVTETGGAQSRQTLRKAMRANPEAQIIFTGCHAELDLKELQQDKPFQDRQVLFIGNSKKHLLVDAALGKINPSPEELLGKIAEADKICNLPVACFGERSRAYLRIQDGCESFCSYCIVPYTRGPSRSLEVAEVIRQAKQYEEAGHKEVVLTGIHLGYYGQDLKPHESIITLLDRLSIETPNLLYRISSLEPMEITEELLFLMKQRRNIQPHFHIPLQSGHDRILSRMNRRYTTAQFKEVVERCNEIIPDINIGIDILAGFPGETEEYFQGAIHFLTELPFTYLHVFPYSRRPGTRAAQFSDQIPKKEKERRVRILRELSEQKKRDYYTKFLGQTRPMVIERKRAANGMLKGFTDNYIDIRLTGPEHLKNSIVIVNLQSIKDTYVIGEVVPDED